MTDKVNETFEKLFRNGDEIIILDGPDINRLGIVTHIEDDLIFAKATEGNWKEMYELVDEPFGFYIDRIRQTKPCLKKGDLVEVRESTYDGKKNINKKASSGLRGKVLSVSSITHKAQIEFSKEVTVSVGLKLLERIGVNKVITRNVKYKSGDIIIAKVNGKVQPVKVNTNSSDRYFSGETVDGEYVDEENKNKVINKITLNAMMSKVNLVKNEELDKETKKEIKELYDDLDKANKMNRSDLRERIVGEIRKKISKKQKISKQKEMMIGERVFNFSRDPFRIKECFWDFMRSKKGPTKYGKLSSSDHNNFCYGMPVDKKNNVFSRPGQVKEIYEAIKDRKIDYIKTPTSRKDNYLGIEIECFTNLSREDLNTAFTTAGLQNNIKLVNDVSIRDFPEEMISIEVTVLSKEKDFNSILDRTIAVLTKAGARVNDSCGLHVHLDMRNRNVNTCYRNLYNSQEFLFNFVPVNRRKNKYCIKTSHSTFKKQVKEVKEQGSTHSRRYAINTDSYRKHNTIELRLHEGSVDSDKIKHWVYTLLGIINTNKLGKAPKTVDDFLNLLNNYSDEQKEQFKAITKQYAQTA